MINEKKHLRNEMLDRRNSIAPDIRLLYDMRIFDRICSLHEYLDSNLVLTYVSFGCEADTIRLIKLSLKNHKMTAVPKILEDGSMDFYVIKSLEDLKPGSGFKGILEPERIEESSVSRMISAKKPIRGIMLVPGLAFDMGMNRLGYGRGYYDRYIKYLNDEHVVMVKTAIMYECQMVNSVPVNSYDMKMDMLVTPDRIVSSRAFC